MELETAIRNVIAQRWGKHRAPFSRPYWRRFVEQLARGEHGWFISSVRYEARQ